MQKILHYKKTLIFLALIAVLVGWYNVEYPSGKWRYKVTVEMTTPEGVKSFSAVRQASLHSQPKILPEAGGKFYNVTKGEAVVIDLGARGVAFALLGGQSEALKVIKDIMPLKQKRPVALTPEEWPRFVYFRDPKDPKTVEALLTYRDVGQAWNASRVFNKDRFAEVFGEGVALKSVTLEVTHEPVTTGVVAEFLPKFSRESPMSIPGQSLFPSDFTKSTK